MTLQFHLKHLFLLIVLSICLSSCSTLKITQSSIGTAWSNNSVNTVIFRNKAITSSKNYQFTAYYNNDGKVVIARRKLPSGPWETNTTQYSGNVKDAHNSISIIIDNDGYLHISWDHHDTKLRYAKSTTPFGLELTQELSMTGQQEERVTYPEFHNLPNGNLLFCYRSGKSGRGNMVINTYDSKQKTWKQLQNNLLNGEEQRSAYWQMTVGNNGSLYLSWVWRESWDVSTNHDICFAKSEDGGITWTKSNNEKYALPITAATAEIAWKIPQNSSLINQTSMVTDKNGNPYIATYWETNGVPQYKVVYLENGNWKLKESTFNTSAFHLGGGGTKSIPLSRPKIFVNDKKIYLLYRNSTDGGRVMLANTAIDTEEWETRALTEQSVGQWEPNYDEELWQNEKQLHIFSQNVVQVDGEGLSETEPQPVNIIEVKHIR